MIGNPTHRVGHSLQLGVIQNIFFSVTQTDSDVEGRFSVQKSLLNHELHLFIRSFNGQWTKRLAWHYMCSKSNLRLVIFSRF